MKVELDFLGLKVEKQKNICVLYRGKQVGNYYADLFVEDRVIVELKAAESLSPEYEAQLINYLKSTNIEVGLLLNFGRKAEFRRKVFSNKQKIYINN